MKYMIASDLHGDAGCIKKMLDRFEEEGADKLLLLGDYLYHGPRNGVPEDYDTQKSAELLNAYKDRIIAIHGNCDAEVDQCLLDFSIGVQVLEFLSDPDEAGSRISIVAQHGHWDPATLPLHKGDIFLHGHTHVSGAHMTPAGYYDVNPGSVSLPKGGTLKSYALWEGRTITLKTLNDGVVFQTLNF